MTAMAAAARTLRTGRLLAILPSVLVGIGWVGIWGLWPHAAGPGSRVASRALVSVCRMNHNDRVHRKPDLFGPPSTLGFSPSRRESEAWQAPRARRLLPPRWLARDAGALASAALPAAGTGGSAGPARYVPVFPPVEPAEPVPPAPAFGLRVRISPALQAAGYAWPEVEAPTNGPAAWDAEMAVDVDGRGRPRGVFVMRGSGNGALDRRIEGLLMRGHATNAPAAGVSGHVGLTMGR